MSIWIKLAAGAAAIYAVVALAAFLGQRKLMYFPDTERAEPSEEGLTGVAERIIETPDGNRLVAWYGKARPGRPTLLYFHGNGGSLAGRAPRIARFMGEGWGVYMLSYRGYGGSTGSPSEAANVADARLAYHALVKEGVPPTSIVVYGESLGSGIAVRIAAELAVAGIILDAPYTSILELAARAYPVLPVRLLLFDRYETTRYIGVIKAPLLILHGARDGVVPVAMGRELVRLAPEPKRLVVFPTATTATSTSTATTPSMPCGRGSTGSGEADGRCERRARSPPTARRRGDGLCSAWAPVHTRRRPRLDEARACKRLRSAVEPA